jgi:two-component system CheB/CheR fusion protein
VTRAGSVAEALAAYDRRPPDVLVSDIGMPGRNGYDLIREVRGRDRRRGVTTRAIAITGFAALQDRSAALAAGFDEHIAKPVDPEVLVAKLRAGGGSA